MKRGKELDQQRRKSMDETIVTTWSKLENNRLLPLLLGQLVTIVPLLLEKLVTIVDAPFLRTVKSNRWVRSAGGQNLCLH
jgi:hypothetical protein